MSHWNHRVLRRGGPGERIFGVYEVYYDDDNQPRYCTSNPVGVVGETKAEMLELLDQMRDALDDPILRYEDF
jgi:hypothetical protein